MSTTDSSHTTFWARSITPKKCLSLRQENSTESSTRDTMLSTQSIATRVVSSPCKRLSTRKIQSILRELLLSSTEAGFLRSSRTREADLTRSTQENCTSSGESSARARIFMIIKSQITLTIMSGTILRSRISVSSGNYQTSMSASTITSNLLNSLMEMLQMRLTINYIH